MLFVASLRRRLVGVRAVRVVGGLEHALRFGNRSTGGGHRVGKVACGADESGVVGSYEPDPQAEDGAQQQEEATA